MKLLSIVGARPQFVKCAVVSREMRKEHKEILVHTGQHYDPEMSDIFFNELCIPRPDYNLEVGSGSHGKQTAEILIKVEDVLIREKPDLVLVYGDTNSTLAGTLAAAKLHIPVAHVEAGLRSFDRTMPEEINRVVTDHLSALLFCPTQTAVDNLAREGISSGVFLTGDVMVDALRFYIKMAEKRSTILEKLPVKKNGYLVMTIHRPANTDNKENMENILQSIREITAKVIFPIHPRTKKYLEEFGLWDSLPDNLVLCEPQGYLDMLHLMQHASMILTDSGGIQKEAYILGVPCVTMRENTEWVETLEGGWNVLVGADTEKIVHAVKRRRSTLQGQGSLFGDGRASEKIVKILSGV